VKENEDPATMLKTLCGTPQYMAPELNKGTLYEGAPVDVWAAAVVLFIMYTGFPPLGEAVKGDWYFDRMRKNQMAKFWQAHERSAQFSDDLKDLFEHLFVDSAADRLTIEQIKAHPWMQGETVEMATLGAELERRKAQVTAAKARERKQKQEAAAQKHVGKHAAYRDVGGGDEAEAPVMSAAVENGHDYLLYSKLSAGALMEETLQALEALKGGDAFKSGGGGTGTGDAAVGADAAGAEGGVQFARKEGELKIKATFPVKITDTRTEPLDLKLAVLQVEGAGEMTHVLHVKRERGPIMKLEGVVDALEDALAHLLFIPNTEGAAAAGEAKENAADGVLGAAAAAGSGGGDDATM
jgi:hypothetical protein